MGQGVVLDVGVEVEAVDGAGGIGGEPPSEFGVIGAVGEVEEVGFRVDALGGKLPGGVEDALVGCLSKGGIAVVCDGLFVAVDDAANVASMV